jgi:uncharacterized membrane protein YgcG
MPQIAYRYEAEVGPDGKLEVHVPLDRGTPVEVVVLMTPSDETSDLVDAARSSFDFWNNPQDEHWNHV